MGCDSSNGPARLSLADSMPGPSSDGSVFGSDGACADAGASGASAMEDDAGDDTVPWN